MEDTGSLDAPPPFGRHDQDELYTQDMFPFQFTSSTSNQQIIPRPDSIRDAIDTNWTCHERTISPSETTPSYDLAVQGPELLLDPAESLPTYDNISNDITGAGFSGNGQIGYPLPAVCRRGQLD